MMKNFIKKLFRKVGLEVSFIKKDRDNSSFFCSNRHGVAALPIEVLTADNKAVFFGYHDKTPFSQDGSKILATAVMADDTKVESQGSIMDIGYYEKKNDEFSKRFKKNYETTLWCWQQGCMLQWHPANPNKEIIFNKLINDQYGSVIYDIENKVISEKFDFPIYSLDPKGKFASSLNFSRLGKLRPGYGYSNLPDNPLAETCSENDGVYLIDLKKGAIELIISLSELADFTDKSVHHYVNHITFSPDGDKLAFFHIYPDKTGRRLVRFYLYIIKTKTLHLLESSRRVSHYCWITEDEIFTTEGGVGGVMYFKYNLNKRNKIEVKIPKIGDLHPMVCPTNCHLIVADSQPDSDRMQHLFLINIATGKYALIDSLYSPTIYQKEIRCDLHPRWDRTGNHIAIDTTKYGKRRMIIYDINRAKALIE